MKKILYFLVALLFACCTSAPKAPSLITLQPWDVAFDTVDTTPLYQTYIMLADNGDLLLPNYVLSTSAIIYNDVIADTILTSPDGKIYHPGDVIKKAGEIISYDTLLTTIQFSTRLHIGRDSIYIYSPVVLSKCRIVLDYTANVIPSQLWGATDYTAAKLEYSHRESDQYVYAAPYSSFDLAPYKYLGCIQVQYRSLDYLGLGGTHAIQNIDMPFIDIGHIVICRSDLEKYFPDLITHIAN